MSSKNVTRDLDSLAFAAREALDAFRRHTHAITQLGVHPHADATTVMGNLTVLAESLEAMRPVRVGDRFQSDSGNVWTVKGTRLDELGLLYSVSRDLPEDGRVYDWDEWALHQMKRL